MSFEGDLSGGLPGPNLYKLIQTDLDLSIGLLSFIANLDATKFNVVEKAYVEKIASIHDTLKRMPKQLIKDQESFDNFYAIILGEVNDFLKADSKSFIIKRSDYQQSRYGYDIKLDPMELLAMKKMTSDLILAGHSAKLEPYYKYDNFDDDEGRFAKSDSHYVGSMRLTVNLK